MSLEIRIVATAKELREFIDLPWKIYAGDLCWVPPLKYLVRRQLDFKRDPFWQHADGVLFLARRNGECIGRISAQIDHAYNTHWNEQVGSFGFFECVDDREVATRLLNTAADWLKRQGMQTVRGPMSPSSHGEYGLLIEGFTSPPVFMMPYNKPYYPALIEQAQFRKAKEVWAYDKHTKLPVPAGVARVAGRIARKPEIKIRRITRKTLSADIDVMMKLYNTCWADNWGFSPINKAEACEFAAAVKHFGREEISLLAYWGDTPVGIYIALPDINQIIAPLNGKLGITGILRLLMNRKNISRCRTVMIGITKEFRKSGLVSCLYGEADNYLREHYSHLEFGWVLDDNVAAQEMMDFVGGKVYKRYGVYEREV
jgi:hypothetical protein